MALDSVTRIPDEVRQRDALGLYNLVTMFTTNAKKECT